jgi:hypothetical protein
MNSMHMSTVMLAENSTLGQHIKNTSLHAAKVHEWPRVLGGDITWDHAALPSEDDSILTLSESDIAEVRAALDTFNSKKVLVLYCYSMRHDH